MSLLIACIFSIFWAIFAIWTYESIPFTGISETARILTWSFFLHTLVASRQVGEDFEVSEHRDGVDVESHFVSLPWFIIALALLQIALTFVQLSSYSLATSLRFLLPTIWISSAITGLVYLESLYRGAEPQKRRTLKPLCLGLAGMFILDFFVFTDTLLFRRINIDVWQVRGIFYACIVPIIAMSIARNPDWAVRIHVSRQAVSSSIAVVGAGAYLIATAMAAQLIQLSGAQWSNVVLITFVLLSVFVLSCVLLSSRIRAQLRVNVSKHFFNFKYDYRKEWLSFTSILSTGIDDAPNAILKGFTQILHSHGGALWAKNTENSWELLASMGITRTTESNYQWQSLEAFLRRTGWIVQLDELKSYPDRYHALELPDEIFHSPDAWLIIPLPVGDDIIGFLIIDRSPIIQTITWEDRDLLKTAGLQAAGLLLQRRSHEALMQARQFEAFSKLSAYVIHDLKNILGQQSLIVSNAEKHKHKAAFVDDVISTVDNSVNRMKSLLEKLREQQTDEDFNAVDLASALLDASLLRPHALPHPTLSKTDKPILIKANRDKLVRVFGHLIQNAQDASSDDETILIKVDEHARLALITISDNGIGMTEDFIRNSLFKPFVSSKGLTGMGIGVYESREYIRKLGGKISVSSKVNKGTVFSITLPVC